jgi:hypothetical protein
MDEMIEQVMEMELFVLLLHTFHILYSLRKCSNFKRQIYVNIFFCRWLLLPSPPLYSLKYSL